jgi:hypothetical protein
MLTTRITTVEEIGISVGAKEALNFSFLGCEGFVGRPLMVPKHVSSTRSEFLGQIQRVDNHLRLRRHVTRSWRDCPEERLTPTKKMNVIR